MTSKFSCRSRTVLIPARRNGQRGVVLIVGMLFLIAIVLLSLAMIRSFGLQEKLAGNTRDKQRSFEAAQNTLAYGEWWLSSLSADRIPTNCATPNAPIASISICSNPLVNPGSTPWSAWTTYQPPNMQVQAGGGFGSSGDINYQAAPGLYISYVGLTPDGRGELYQVDAFSGGGSYETMSAVQSIYKLQSAAKDLGGL